MNPYVSRTLASTSHGRIGLHSFGLCCTLVLFGGAYSLAEVGDIPESSRTLMFVMLGAIIVTNAMWQAAGLALARLENVILPRTKAPVSHD